MIIIYAADRDKPQAREIAGAKPAVWRNPQWWKGEIEGCKSALIVGNYPEIAEAYRAAGVEVETYDSQHKARALKSVEDLAASWAEVKAQIAGKKRWTAPAKGQAIKEIQGVFLGYHEHDKGSGNDIAAALSMSEDAYDLPALAEKEPADALGILIAESSQPEPAAPDPPEATG